MTSLMRSSRSPRLPDQNCQDKLHFMAEKSSLFAEMQKCGAFSNCTIDVDGTPFNVHLEILCASSEYFDNIIRRDSVIDDVVSLHNIAPSTFSTLLNYLYTGRIEVNLCNVLDVYVAADFLILNSVLDYCRKALSKSLQHETSPEAFDVILDILSRYDDALIFEDFALHRNLFKRKDVLQRLGVDYFFKYLRVKKRISLTDGRNALMGRYFIAKLQDILLEIFPEESRLITKEDYPTRVIQVKNAIATMPTYDESVDHVDERTYVTCENYPPTDWTICKIKFYIIPSWGGTPGLVGGADLEYRNIWTGERQMAPSPIGNFMLPSYEVEELELEEGETLSSIEVNSGWLVDKLVFVTSTGRRVGPFGHSSGGGLRKVTVNRCHNPRGDSSEMAYSCLALHGFSYSLVRTLGRPSWFNVHFLCAAVEGRCTLTIKI
ncbi:Zinc finger and BTB domain-containing protein 8A [Taenia crassiceps]|uniref:Zinc finger and BTB domain-containing protein 8A n=1 Tax=Taenia crassiceps TaxID=6207 RepID=A0ABR4QQR3_9CEST